MGFYRSVLLGIFSVLILMSPLSARAWTQIPSSGSVTSVAVMPDKSILGVGLDKQLWTRATLNSPWTLVPNSGSVIGIAVLPDSSILGVGTDNQLWTRTTLTSEWKLVPNSAAVIAVTIMPDGTILGVGTDKQLYTRATVTSAWVLVPNSGSVVSVTVMQDGTILGVGTDKQLWTRAALSSTWVQIPQSGSVSSAASMADGTILGVGLDGALWTRPQPERQRSNDRTAAAAAGNSSAATKECPGCPWVPASFAGQRLPLASQAEVWSEPKPFRRASGDLTVQSRFLWQKGTTCRFEVQFNNVSNKPIDEGILLGRPGKAAVSQYDTVLRARLAPATSVAYGTEVRECPGNWGETKSMEKCASCEPTVYFVRQ